MSTLSVAEGGRTGFSRRDWDGKPPHRAVSAPPPSTAEGGIAEADGHATKGAQCSAWSESITSEAASGTGLAAPTQDNYGPGPADDEVVPRIFTRRALSPSKADGHRAMLRGCCDRCKSDLNGKLLACCTACGLCRHLYCFLPPLKQHPALEERPDAKRRVSATIAQAMIAQWKCSECVRSLAGRSPSLCQQGQPHNEDDQIKSTPLKKRPRHVAPPSENGTTTTTSSRRMVNVPVVKHVDRDLPVSETNGSPPPADENRPTEFDWYAFRSQKAARVLGQPGTTDELVFYSRSVALMRKTARFWRQYVQQKRLRSHLSAQRDRWVTGPQIYDVKRVLSEDERVKAEASRHRRKTEKADAIRLFADENADVVYYRPPRREYSIAAVDAEMDGDRDGGVLNESGAVSRLLVEVVERIAMAGEDEDREEEPAHSDGGYESSHPSILGLHLAATVIQRLVRVRLNARRQVRTAMKKPPAASVPEVAAGVGDDLGDHHEDAKHLALERRRGRATASLQHLALCARFVGVLLSKLRQRQRKTALIALLAASSPRPATPDDSDVTTTARDGEAVAVVRSRAAQARIVRFFHKFVGPRVDRRKFVMARRVQRWWKRTTRRRKWTALASSYRLQVRDTACRRVQRLYRSYRAKYRFQLTLEKLALRSLRLFLRRWIVMRLVKKERARVQLYSAALRLSVVPDGLADRPEATELEILACVGMALCRVGDLLSAAFVFEKRAKARGLVDAADSELEVAFAYSHHMTWYSSYDASNLLRAHDLYCSALEVSARVAGSAVDPEVLQDLALVKMHVGDTDGSLRLLAKLIEHFPREPGLSLWLLVAAVQLQQRGDWEQSVEYLTYVQDAPPPPYLERDVLVLCAIGLQHCGGEASTLERKEAWRAALRLWSMDKRAMENGGGQANRFKAVSAQARLKWEVVTDLASRALEQGHYLLSIQAYTHAMARYAEAAGPSEHGTAWWGLADAYRHLGRLDLYLDAAKRSQQCGGELTDEGAVAAWKEHAVRSSHSFQDELNKLSAVDKLRQLDTQQ